MNLSPMYTLGILTDRFFGTVNILMGLHALKLCHGDNLKTKINACLLNSTIISTAKLVEFPLVKRI
jgi:hypothetical protein